jgi:hypothetical protein
LGAKGQGSDYRVAQVALVGVVAVDAQATPAQCADHLVSIQAMIFKDDVSLWLARGNNDQGKLGTRQAVTAEFDQGVVGCFVESLNC